MYAHTHEYVYALADREHGGREGERFQIPDVLALDPLAVLRMHACVRACMYVRMCEMHTHTHAHTHTPVYVCV